jgi:hypothetical protein
MNQHAATPNTSATPEKRALLEAFDTVLKTKAEEREAERAAAEARRRAKGMSRLLMVVCTTILVFTTVYLYVERPEWVFPPAPAPESEAVREASLRIAVATAVQHIQRYQRQTGRLPGTLQQAGAHPEGLDYERTAIGYHLTGEGGGARVAYTSGESLPRFLGNSFEVITRRPR